LVGVRLQPADLAALDAWIAAQPEPKPSRPAALRVLVRPALRRAARTGKVGPP
jgi:hypothetical protein